MSRNTTNIAQNRLNNSPPADLNVLSEQKEHDRSVPTQSKRRRKGSQLAPLKTSQNLLPPPPKTGFGETIIASNPFDDSLTSIRSQYVPMLSPHHNNVHNMNVNMLPSYQNPRAVNEHYLNGGTNVPYPKNMNLAELHKPIENKSHLELGIPRNLIPPKSAEFNAIESAHHSKIQTYKLENPGLTPPHVNLNIAKLSPQYSNVNANVENMSSNKPNPITSCSSPNIPHELRSSPLSSTPSIQTPLTALLEMQVPGLDTNMTNIKRELPEPNPAIRHMNFLNNPCRSTTPQLLGPPNVELPGNSCGVEPKPLTITSGRIYPFDQPMIFNPQNPSAPPIYACGGCHKEINDNDEAIFCESGCNFFFHR